MPAWGIPLEEIAAYAAALPPDSATVRAADPDAWISPQIQMLRELDHDLRVLAWMQTVDGQKGRNYPARRALTVAEKAAERDEAARNGDIAFDTTTKDKMLQLLGW